MGGAMNDEVQVPKKSNTALIVILSVLGTLSLFCVCPLGFCAFLATPAGEPEAQQQARPRPPSREDIFKRVRDEQTKEYQSTVKLHKNDSIALFQVGCLQTAAGWYARGVARSDSSGKMATEAHESLVHCQLSSVSDFEELYGAGLAKCMAAKVLAFACMGQREIPSRLWSDDLRAGCNDERAAAVVVCGTAQQQAAKQAKREEKARAKRRKNAWKKSNNPMDLPSLSGR
jgi:hypothetical protein